VFGNLIPAVAPGQQGAVGSPHGLSYILSPGYLTALKTMVNTVMMLKYLNSKKSLVHNKHGNQRYTLESHYVGRIYENIVASKLKRFQQAANLGFSFFLQLAWD
jgi:hypothetical protein